MTLVQIDLRRSREPRPSVAPPRRPGPGPARVLGIGLILLVPLAEQALRNLHALVLLLTGLAMLGLLAAQLRPAHGEVDPP